LVRKHFYVGIFSPNNQKDITFWQAGGNFNCVLLLRLGVSYCFFSLRLNGTRKKLSLFRLIFFCSLYEEKKGRKN
jgi:hypothetical protein